MFPAAFVEADTNHDDVLNSNELGQAIVKTIALLKIRPGK